MEFFKDIFIALVGGAVAFVISIVVWRIQRRTAQLSWRQVSKLHLPNKEMTATTLEIENGGRAAAEAVTFRVACPENVTIASHEVSVSEEALPYEPDVTDTELTIRIPWLPPDVTLTLAVLTSYRESAQLKVSLVAKEAVGKEETETAYESSSRSSRRLRMLLRGVLILYFALVVYMGFRLYRLDTHLGVATVNYNQDMRLAQVMNRLGMYKEAKEHLEGMKNKRRYFRSTWEIHYQLAVSAEGQAKHEEALQHLERAVEEAPRVIRVLQHDDVFSTVRQLPGYKRLEQRFQKTEINRR